MGRYAEDELIAEATELLGGTVAVLAAGYFGLRNLAAAQVAGGTAGALAGALSDSPLGAGLGAGLGGAAAVAAAAEAQGLTVQVVVAITADTIEVLNRDTDGRLATTVASFDRHRAHVRVSRLGLSRVVEIADDDGTRLTLEGSTSPISQLSRGDKAVLAELVS